jgi:DNA-directed RNA polymerase subunit K/omega
MKPVTLSRGTQIDLEQCVDLAGGSRYDLVIAVSNRLRELKRRARETGAYVTAVDALLEMQQGKIDYKIIVDHIKYWHPLPDKPINPEIVDDYLLDLKRRFYFGLVTYDQYNSLESIRKMQKAGLPAKCTRFTFETTTF